MGKKVAYDTYYQTEDLFGQPYPELMDFYSSIKKKGKLLDVGCGQGRDALALARLGFEVTGIDISEVGIQQLLMTATKENLPLQAIVTDIYEFPHFQDFDFILLDSMFHFGKKEKEKETRLLNRIFHEAKPLAFITICLQNSGNKWNILKSILSENPDIDTVHTTELVYEYVDRESQYRSQTPYMMVSIQKRKIFNDKIHK